MSQGSSSQKQAIIVGAGIVGLTQAWVLVKAGYSVTVLDRNSEPGEGTSKANAGQLLYDRIGAMGSPGFLKALPQTLKDPDNGVNISGLAHPAHWYWSINFLTQCTNRAWKRNTKALLQIAHRSREIMETVREEHDISFKWRKPGKIITHATRSALQTADDALQYHKQFGGRHDMISQEQCFELEPALQDTQMEIAGGIHLPDAQIGDCSMFCKEFAKLLASEYDVKFRMNVNAYGLEKSKRRISAIATLEGPVSGDLFIIATGADDRRLLPFDFPGRKPVIGIKGLSLTFPVGQTPPDLSVTDSAGKFLVMRLGDQLRVTGFALFSRNAKPEQKYVDTLTAKARRLMPQAALYETTPEIWMGSRPTTDDDVPMMGRAGAENLYVNAGHGSLGWTLGFGAADMLSKHIAKYQY
ncbi:MAG: FAD-dependent oxidoreductase [Cohaesibacteraceae bacterium]|nr:FAD-dependent oxidoreductase [Cohaesibacteraceae bacterium]